MSVIRDAGRQIAAEGIRYHRLGMPVPAVSNYLGHQDSSITLRVYAHMIDGTSGMAATAMDQMLEDEDNT